MTRIPNLPKPTKVVGKWINVISLKIESAGVKTVRYCNRGLIKPIQQERGVPQKPKRDKKNNKKTDKTNVQDA